MNFGPLPDDWPDQRDTLHFLAAHVLGQARQRHDGMFDLVPSPGGFATPSVGPDRERVRLVGGSMLVERVAGETLRDATATTTVAQIAGSSLAELCQQVGETRQLFPGLFGLRMFHQIGGEFLVARELGEPGRAE